MNLAPSMALPGNGRTNWATLVRTFTRSQTDNPLTRPGDIYLARFPFGDVSGMKLRPVLFLTGAVGPVPEVLVAYISSVIPSQPLPSDIMIDPTKFPSTNLKTSSALRLHKLATIH